MKHFIVCTNPNCDKAFHVVNEAYLSKALESGLPVVMSLTGEMPPAEVASMIIRDLLGPDSEDQIEDMATEKSENSSETGEGSVEPTTSEGPDVRGTAPVVDNYYNSEEYFKVRHEMEYAQLRNLEANTALINAKARKIETETRILEGESDLRGIKLAVQAVADKPTK